MRPSPRRSAWGIRTIDPSKDCGGLGQGCDEYRANLQGRLCRKSARISGGAQEIAGYPHKTEARCSAEPVLLFGSGGVMVEVYNDVALRRCPITRSEAQAMIAEVKGARLLQGFRGRPAADLAALADTLVRVSHLAMHLEGHLAELDINPLMVLPSGQGVKAVDALVVFRGT